MKAPQGRLGLLLALAGLAGVIGVTAQGVRIARAERERRAYTPDEIRAHLRDRHAALEDSGPASDADGAAQGRR